MFYKFLKLYHEQDIEICVKAGGYFYYGKIVQLYEDCILFHTEVEFEDGNIKDAVEMVLPIRSITFVYKTILSIDKTVDMETTIQDLIKDEAKDDSTD